MGTLQLVKEIKTKSDSDFRAVTELNNLVSDVEKKYVGMRIAQCLQLDLFLQQSLQRPWKIQMRSTRQKLLRVRQMTSSSCSRRSSREPCHRKTMQGLESLKQPSPYLLTSRLCRRSSKQSLP